MTHSKILMAIAILCLIFNSCIKSEALNSEADIESCIIPEGILIAEPKIENDRITLMLNPAADVTNVPINFILTPGATIEPENGTTRDFSNGEKYTYTVTSEDNKWKKIYTLNTSVSGIRTSYDFENYRFFIDKSSGKEVYYEFYEIAENGEEQNIWASGNPGFKFVASGKAPEDYPTVSYENGRTGRCLKLETRSTGSLGSAIKKPIAAGNLFIGSYGGELNALKATHFGVPFTFVPTGLTGYYKYKAGEVYKNETGTVIPDKKDNFDIYAIMYETDDKVKYLDGSNSLTSPNLVAIARISDDKKKETDTWTHFSLPFNMLPGKEIDPKKLANNQYNVSVVFSSSIEGATFSGAVGSTLFIDQVELIHLK